MSADASNETRKPFQFTDPQQAKIHQNLALFGQGPAAMFRDACAIMQDRYDLITATHIVGHLSREVLGALLTALIPPDKEAEFTGDNKNAQKAEFALTTLGFSQTDFAWHFWVKDVIGGDYQLHRLAHRSGLYAPRPLGADFRTFWTDFVNLLDQLLDASRNHLLEISRPFEELARKPNPTADDVKNVFEKLPHYPVYLRRFLEKIESNAWIQPLDERGYFDNPPLAVSVDGLLRAEPWPQGQFLVRMAPVAPGQIAGILQRIEWPWNPYLIFRDIIDVIKAVDISNARPLVVKLDSWVDKHGLAIVEHSVGELIAHLGQNGACDLSLQLAERILVFDDRGKQRHRFSGPLQTVVDEYTFEQTVGKWIEPTVKVLPLDAITLLCNTLRDGISIIAPDFGSRDFITEMHGCELVDNDRPRSIHGVLNSILRAIRDHAGAAVAAEAVSLKEICDLLDRYEPRVFVRLKVYLVARCASKNTDIVRALLLNRELFFAPWLFSEFNYLAEHGFAVLSASERSRYLTMVTRVPGHIEQLGESTREPAFERWQLSRLMPIVDHLPPEWRTRYETLNEKHGQALQVMEEMRKGRLISRGVSIPHDDLGQMEVGQVVDFVKSWRPERDDEPFSDYELHRALEHLVASDPQRFTQHVQLLHQLDLDSIRWFFSGLSRALKEKRAFDWAPVVEFAVNIYERSPEGFVSSADENEANDDRPLTELHKSILCLIEEGIRTNECGIPDALLGKTLDIIEMGMCDPDPSVEEDLQHTQSGRAVDAAINCARGIAFEALYHFLHRIKSDDDRLSQYWLRIRVALDKYLSNPQSHRLSVHSMVGQLFPLLCDVDRSWVMGAIDIVFPTTKVRRSLFASAWEGYVWIWTPGRDPFTDLRPRYVVACSYISEIFGNDGTQPSFVAQRTAEHIVRAFGYGTIDLEDDDQLLVTLFSKSSAELRSQSLNIAGEYWSGADITNPQAKQFAHRMQRLYEWRLNECRKIADSNIALLEAWAINNWPSGGFPDVDWWLDQVTIVLTTWNATPPHPRFTEYLAACANDYPDKVLTIIERLVDANHPEWAMVSMRKNIKEAFEKILARNRAQYGESIRKLINRFSTSGVTGFDELLS